MAITNEKSRLMFKLALYQVIEKIPEKTMKSQEKMFKINSVIF